MLLSTAETLKQRSQKFMNWQACSMLAVLIATVADQFWLTRLEFPVGIVVVGISLFICGVLLLCLSLKGLGKSLAPQPIPKSDGELVTGGIYALCRHPIYLAIGAAETGWTLVFSSWIGMILLIPLFVVLREKAKFEEHLLIEKFGSAYLEYMNSVGRFFPRL